MLSAGGLYYLGELWALKFNKLDVESHASVSSEGAYECHLLVSYRLSMMYYRVTSLIRKRTLLALR